MGFRDTHMTRMLCEPHDENNYTTYQALQLSLRDLAALPLRALLSLFRICIILNIAYANSITVEGIYLRLGLQGRPPHAKRVSKFSI